MSAVTSTGPRSASERAIVRWNLDTTESPEEQAATRRMMTALRRLAPSEKAEPKQPRERDMTYWRNRRDDNLRRENARLERQRQMRKRYAR